LQPSDYFTRFGDALLGQEGRVGHDEVILLVVLFEVVRVAPYAVQVVVHKICAIGLETLVELEDVHYKIE